MLRSTRANGAVARQAATRDTTGLGMDMQELADIDAMIREEKRLSAIESQTETWAEGLSSGIEPEILADAALSTAFSELLRTCSEETALVLIDRIRERIIAGEFEPDQSWH